MVQINKLKALALKLGLLFSKIQGEHSLMAFKLLHENGWKKTKKWFFFHKETWNLIVKKKNLNNSRVTSHPLRLESRHKVDFSE